MGVVGLTHWGPGRWTVLAPLVPFAGGLACVGLLTYDHFDRLNDVSLVLASAALLLVVVRTALLFAENQRMISRIHEESRTDPLTGLRNRRSLMDDLAGELALATAGEPRAIVLFDLDGFKEYNDAFGHPAGDELPARLGQRLADAVAGQGRAYRLGATSSAYCRDRPPTASSRWRSPARRRSASRAEGFDITASRGAVLAPAAARTATEALQLADRRMYARKGERRLSVNSQTSQAA